MKKIVWQKTRERVEKADKRYLLIKCNRHSKQENIVSIIFPSILYNSVYVHFSFSFWEEENVEGKF